NNLLLGEGIYNQPATKTKAPSHQNITTEDVDRIVNTSNPSPASSSGQENITKADLQAIAKSFQETISQAIKTLNNRKKSANKRGEDLNVRHFLSDLMREKGNEAPDDDYNYDPIDDITDSMAGMTLNKAILSAIKCAVKKSSSGRKCSSQNCSQKKKKKSKKSKKGKVNLATVDSNSDSSSDISSSDSFDSDTSSSDSSDSESDITVNIAKSKKSEAEV
ncbi:hypothetical protein C1645_819234, partial [Glomus cerebriforme]